MKVIMQQRNFVHPFDDVEVIAGQGTVRSKNSERNRR